jgi:hypothetical protein
MAIMAITTRSSIRVKPVFGLLGLTTPASFVLFHTNAPAMPPRIDQKRK